MSDNKFIKVVIRDTETVIFDGEAERVTSVNEVGRFDVYPLHANFISIIKQELAIYHNKEKIKELQIEQAVMKVKENIVHIFLGIEPLFAEEELTGAPVPPVPPVPVADKK